MAYPTAVNDEQTNPAADPNAAPDTAAQAQAAVESLENKAMKMFNEAIQPEQQQNTAHQAATIQGVDQVYSNDTMAAAVAAEKISKSQSPADTLTDILAVAKAFNAPRDGQAK